MQPADPRKLPRQRRSQATVDVILEATTRVFDDLGYEATTTNRVAERAGVSIGSVYQYFPNKDALLTALHERHIDEVTASVASVLNTGAARPWREQLRAVVDEILRLHTQRPRLQQVLHLERPWLERPSADSNGTRRLAQAAAQWLVRHRDGMTIIDVDAAAETVLRLIEGMVHAAVLDRRGNAVDASVATSIREAVEGYLVVPRG